MPEPQTAAANEAFKAQTSASPTAKRQRLTSQQRIAKLQAQLAMEKTRLHKRSRQMDTREKIVVGGAVIKAMRADEAFRRQIVALLRADVNREIDQEAIASWLSGTST